MPDRSFKARTRKYIRSPEILELTTLQSFDKLFCNEQGKKPSEVEIQKGKLILKLTKQLLVLIGLMDC